MLHDPFIGHRKPNEMTASERKEERNSYVSMQYYFIL